MIVGKAKQTKTTRRVKISYQNPGKRKGGKRCPTCGKFMG